MVTISTARPTAPDDSDAKSMLAPIVPNISGSPSQSHKTSTARSASSAAAGCGPRLSWSGQDGQPLFQKSAATMPLVKAPSAPPESMSRRTKKNMPQRQPATAAGARFAAVSRIMVQPSSAPSAAPSAAPTKTCVGPRAIVQASSLDPVMARQLKIENQVIATMSSNEAATIAAWGTPSRVPMRACWRRNSSGTSSAGPTACSRLPSVSASSGGMPKTATATPASKHICFGFVGFAASADRCQHWF